MAVGTKGTGSKRTNKIVKVKKNGTPSSRKHRFESFSQRVAKLTIDPVRRTRRPDLDDSGDATTNSYFKTSLQEWQDLNLTGNFTEFARDVQPLCESLPQILHHQDQIVDTLVAYIEKKDSLSSEPLLSLIAHLAHDLGTRFEKHFAKTVTAVSRLAAHHPNIEVIEWSFNCLAWLFKYLSKLLVSDLRPLFDLIAPLLGKEPQKPFIARFAAEAMSFLIRKAGAVYDRDQRPLDLVVGHALQDLMSLGDRGDATLYSQGLMTLFAEAVKGVQQSLHTNSAAIFRCLIQKTIYLSRGYDDLSYSPDEVLLGVLIAVSHHADDVSFQPVLDLIFHYLHADAQLEANDPSLLSEVLFVIVSTRKRADDLGWSSIIKTLGRLIEYLNHLDPSLEHVRKKVVRTLAITVSFAPLDSLIPHLRLIDFLSSPPWQDHFLSFCIYTADLDSIRFQDLVLPSFQRFFISKWDAYSEKLCIVIPALAAKCDRLETTLTTSTTIEDEISISFERLQSTNQERSTAQELLYRCNSFLDLMDTIQLRSSNNRSKITLSLLDLLEKALQDSCELRIPDWIAFAAGRGFRYLALDPRIGHHIRPLLRQLCAKSYKLKSVPGFLFALKQSLDSSGDELNEIYEGEEMEVLLESILECLQSPSHDLRLEGLKLLEAILKSKKSNDSEVLHAALSIEQAPFNVESLRAASMYTRKIASGYSAVADTWLQKALPAYCFGLLHVKLAPLWEDACNALKEMSLTTIGEETNARIAVAWIQGIDAETVDTIEPTTPLTSLPSKHTLSDFEDWEGLKLEALFKSAVETVETAHDQLNICFQKRNEPLPLQSVHCRTQALRVLNKIPAIAEKRSRVIVPVLLDWSNEKSITKVENKQHEVEPDIRRWSRKDQKAMLGLLAQFVNPRVLYKSNEVYQALLTLLCKGDVEVQTSALKAILTWKQPSVKRYEEHLMNILDDAKFREELATFLNIEQDDSELQNEDWTDLMPVLLRLLYGRIISRTGSSSRGGQQARRRAVFGALTRLGSKETAQFLDVILYPIHQLRFVHEKQFRNELLDQELLLQRRQLGLVKMLEDLLGELGSGLALFASQLTGAAIYCTVRSSRILHNATTSIEDEFVTTSTTSSLRTIRQAGIRCLNLLFEHCPDQHWECYVPIIFHELIDPRLDKLPIESAQSPSGLLQIFSTWCGSLRYAPFLMSYNEQLVEKLSEILGIPSAKDEVQIFVIKQILGSLVTLANTDTSATPPALAQKQFVRERILQPNVNHFLTRLARILKGSPSKDLLDVAVQAVSWLGPFVVGSSDSRTLVEISIFLLQQPSKRVRPHIKSNVLKIIEQFMPRANLTKQDSLFHSTYETLSSLFGFFRDRIGQMPSRRLLCNVFGQLARIDSELEEAAHLCSGLNAMSKTRLDEPDFERRSQVFNTITEKRYNVFSARQWQPLVYNMVFFIKDEDELVTRTNASYGLRRFVECATNKSHDDQLDEGFERIMSTVLLPGIFNGVRDTPELVRIEYLSVLAAVIRGFPKWTLTNDMQNLLVGDDEEASFFTNILHIQQHRRLRALRRLGTEANSGLLRSKNISQFFIPLIEHFIFDRAEDETAHNLAAETIVTVKALVAHLEWSQYRAIFQRYLSYLHGKPEETQKTTIRLLGAVVDALAPVASKVSETTVQDFIIGTVLAPLTDYLHHRDESTVSLRVPVAVITVKLFRQLPIEELSLRLPPVLMDICHILRSRDQGSRDMTRKTLSEISTIIGPRYFGFILKELRSALQRGYQLHVLSFTVHSILIEAMPLLTSGDLDYCVSDVVSVIMDDIFGVTGQEKDAEEYISKMKEVKSSKSFDSMELLAKVTTLGCLSKLIRPIQSLLLEKLNDKLVRKIDELLRRIGLGVSHNETVRDRDILVFCFEITKEVYGLQNNPKASEHAGGYKMKRYLVNMKGSAKSGNRGSTSSYIYKLVRFSLDLLRSALQKHEELKTPANLSGFMPMISDALVGGQEEIQISAIRLLAAIVKVPLPQIDNNASLYVGEAVRIIKASPSTNSEISQAALKLVSAILRERRNTDVKETDLAYLLEALLPDLHEPDRQGVTFNFLRALLALKVVINEVYQVMDEVASVMVTNQTRGIRDTARAAYYQFLMEYPQGKKRLEKQLSFFCQNLDYKYAEGRQSIMEMMHVLLSKTGDEPVQDMLSTFFPFLVIRLNNEEDPNCQEMLEVLIKKVLERADEIRLKTFLRQLKSYLEQEQQLMLKKAALRVWTLYLDQHGESAKDTQYFQEQVESIINNSHGQIEGPTTESVLPTALASALRLCKRFQTRMLSDDVEIMWGSIILLSSSSGVNIQLPATQLLGLLFNDFASHNANGGLQNLPLTGSGGIQLDGEGMLQLMVAGLRTMNSVALNSEPLMNQTVRNLVFLGRCLGANEMLWKSQPTLGADADEEDEIEAVELDEEATPISRMTAIHYFLTRLCRILRRNEMLHTTTSPKLPALLLLGALINHLNPTTLSTSLPTILTALNNLTDATVTHSSQLSQTEKLTDLAREITDKIKDKVGTAAFVKSMGEVRGDIREKREERRKKRTLSKVTEEGLKRLESAKRRKVEARREREKEMRKVKGVIYKGKRRRLYE